MLINIENLLLKSAMEQDFSEEFKIVTDFFGSDIDKNLLSTQLLTYKLEFKEFKGEKVTLKDVIEVMIKPENCFLTEISTVLTLILVVPATNAQSERIFSALKLIKTNPRKKMEQDRLNDLMFLFVHKKETQNLSLAAVANKFSSMNDRRKNNFGVQKFI